MIRQVNAAEETKLRRWLMKHDYEFAAHGQLKHYFLTASSNFGTLASVNEAGEFQAVCFFSTYSGKSYIHQVYGADAECLERFVKVLGRPCQAFIRKGCPVPADWRAELEVTPGFVVDHPAYDGVFSRVVPRHDGTVYEVE